MATATLMDTDMSYWAPGTLHYRTDDGRDYAVKSGCELNELAQLYVNEVLEAVGEAPLHVQTPAGHRLVPRPTVLIPCNPDGTPIDMTPSHTFPPGTCHEDAVRAALT